MEKSLKLLLTIVITFTLLSCSSFMTSWDNFLLTSKGDPDQEMLRELIVQDKAGNLEAALRFADDIEGRGEDGDTLLLYALRNGKSLSVIEVLLSNGAKPGTRDKDGYTALHLASSSSARELLIAYGADIHVTADDGTTVLMTAIERGEGLEEAKVLISQGASWHSVNDNGESALDSALKAGDEETFLYLISLGANGDLSAFLVKAIENGSGTVDMLLELGADPSAQYGGTTALIEAVEKDDKNLVAKLIASGADVNAVDTNGETALLHAYGKGNMEIAELLYLSGAGLEFSYKDGSSLLVKAVEENDDIEFIKTLLELGLGTEDADEDGRTALMHASILGREDVCSLLLDFGAYVDATDRNGETALLLAYWSGNTGIAKLLVANGADINARYSNGDTLLLKAMDNGDQDAVEALLELGIDTDAVDSDGCTALFHAYKEEDIQTLRLLLSHGAESHNLLPRAVKDGKSLSLIAMILGSGVSEDDMASALVYAAGSNDPDTLSLLIDNGALEGMNGENLDYTLECAYESDSCLQILLENGIDPSTLLLRAITDGDTAKLSLLLGYADIDGEEGLIETCYEKSSPECLSLLLQAGAVCPEGLLLNAIEDGKDKSWVSALLDNGIAPGPDALHLSYDNGQYDIFLMFLENGSDINETCSDGSTILMKAVKDGKSIEEIAFILSLGADTEVLDNDGDTALSLAYGDVDMMDLLLSSGASPEKRLLDKAIADRETEIIETLLSYGASSDGLIIEAYDEGLYGICLILLENGSDINETYSDGSTILMKAVKDGKSIEEIAYILSLGADTEATDNDGDTALSLAYGDLDLMDLLLSSGASPERRLLDKAIADRETGIIETLLSYGASSDGLLIEAYDEGLYGICLILLENGSDINETYTDGSTILMKAVKGGKSIEEIAYILSLGADADAADNEGLTALHHAYLTDDFDIAKLLYEEGADVNALFPDGSTILVKAVRDSSPWTAAVLDAGIDVNARDNSGYAALHYAFDNADYDLCEDLLAHGADINARYPDGTSFLSKAVNQGLSDEILESILSYGLETD